MKEKKYLKFIKNKTKILLLLLSFAFIGCASTRTFPVKLTHPEHKIVLDYKFREIKSVKIGSNILTASSIFTVPCFKARYTYQPPNAGISPMAPIVPDQDWVAVYQHENCYILASFQYDRRFGIVTDNNGFFTCGRPWVGVTVHNEDKEYFNRMFQKAWELPENPLFVSSGQSVVEGSYKLELSLGSIKSDVIEIIEKEYVDDFSTPKKEKSHFLDLNIVNVFSIKGVTFKLISHTTSEIVLMLINDDELKNHLL